MNNKNRKFVSLLIVISLIVISYNTIIAKNSGIAKDKTINKPDSASIQAKISWKKIIDTKTTTMNYNYVGFLNETYGLTVGYVGETNYTNNGSKTWTRTDSSAACRFGLDIVDKNNSWSVGNGGQVRVTNDGAKTWQAVTDFGKLEPNQCRLVSFINNKTGWVADPNIMFGSTSDGGKTWLDVKKPDGLKDIAAIFLKTPTDGFILSASGILYITNDGTKSWNKKDLGIKKLKLTDDKMISTSMPSAVVNFSDSKNGIVAFFGKTSEGRKMYIMNTIDGGTTWKQEIFKFDEDYSPIGVYLSHDSKYLTFMDFNNHIVVYKR